MKNKFQPHYERDRALQSLDALVDAGLVTDEKKPILAEVEKRYAIAVTPQMAALIQNPDDVIARQFIPSEKELITTPVERSDPIGDYTHAPMKALVHRHRDRVLLKPTHVCAVYCRFCFRRDMIGPEGDPITQQDVDDALDYIAIHDEISEVILTGGDPLMLAPKKLASLLQRLQAIPHVKWIRIHTRIPVMAPDKISDEMLAALKTIKPVIMAIHANHAREFTVAAGAALARLAHTGITLLGQSVLLKGVNNTVSALQDLVMTMMQNRVKPYYLHHPDMTVGTRHFRFALTEGMALVEALSKSVPGVCVPHYMLDIPGGVTKIPITSDNIKTHPTLKNAYFLMDREGNQHLYQEDVD